MSIEIHGDENNLVKSSSYPYAKYPFENFNPVQSKVFKFIEDRDNLLVASATGSGKTICSELFAAQEIRKNNKKVIYVSPLRSLAQEKHRDWSNENCHFSDMKISICTGDFRITKARIEELDEANIIAITAEALNSRARNSNSESSKFLKDTGTVIFDEGHLLTVPGRGPHVESAIMKLAEINPEIRFVILSATLPNVEEVAEWISTITKRKTNVIRSQFRPVKLNIHFPTYKEIKDYDMNEHSKVTRALKIIGENSSDKFLCFVHSKRTGDILLQQLRANNIKCAFHNANLTLKERMKIEEEFREGDLRIMVATSTLAWGIEMPARRVIIVGVHSGKREIEWYDALQMSGRAGRPRYDKEGDTYILLPDMSYLKYKTKIVTPRNIESQLKDPSVLAFHIVNEIHRGMIKNIKDIEPWYLKTFAFMQKGHSGLLDCKEAITKLEKAMCIKNDNGDLETTPIGTVASMFYFDPFDVSSLYKNYRKANGKGSADWSFALSCIPSRRSESITSAEAEEIDKWYAEPKIRQSHLLYSGDPKFNGEVKSAFILHKSMQGQFISSPSLVSLSRAIKDDFSRTIEMLEVLDTMSGNIVNKGLWQELKARVIYGVEVKYVPLVQLTGIGKVKAAKLYDAGFVSLEKISQNPEGIAKVLKCKIEAAQKISEEAKTIQPIS